MGTEDALDAKLDAKLDALDARLDAMPAKLDAKLDALHAKLDTLLERARLPGHPRPVGRLHPVDHPSSVRPFDDTDVNSAVKEWLADPKWGPDPGKYDSFRSLRYLFWDYLEAAAAAGGEPARRYHIAAIARALVSNGWNASTIIKNGCQRRVWHRSDSVEA